MLPPPPRSTLFPYTTLFRSAGARLSHHAARHARLDEFSARALSRPRFLSRCARSEEHTSELQSRFELVCRLLLEKKNLPPARSPAASRPRFARRWSSPPPTR